jgi:tetratricopeptide (TPR) repeat protein
VADRYTYIPSIGLFFLAGLAFHRLYFSEGPFEVLRKVSLVIILGVLVSILAVITYKRCDVWQDSETLWTDNINKSRRPYMPYNNLGFAYATQGRMDEAIEEFKKAISSNPRFAEAHNNLGNAYTVQGRVDEAISEYKEAIRLAPEYAEAHFNLGLAYKIKGLKNEAIREFERVLMIRSDDQEARRIIRELHVQPP